MRLYDTCAGEADHEHADPPPRVSTPPAGAPGAGRDCTAQRPGSRRRAATITTAAAAAEEDRLPDQVADLRRYHRTVTARLRREHRIDHHAAHDRSAQDRTHARIGRSSRSWPPPTATAPPAPPRGNAATRWPWRSQLPTS